MHAAPSCVGDIDMLRCDGKLFMNSDGKGTFTHDADQDMDPLALANIECATKLASDCAPWADPAACAACFEAWILHREAFGDFNDDGFVCCSRLLPDIPARMPCIPPLTPRVYIPRRSTSTSSGRSGK